MMTDKQRQSIMQQNYSNICVACGRMGRLTKKPPRQRKEKSNKTAEEPDQESHHSVRSLYGEGVEGSGGTEQIQPPKEALCNQEKEARPNEGQGNELVASKTRIMWPKASEMMKWEMLDEDLNKILDITLTGAVDKKLKTMATIVISVAKERFGVEKTKEKKPASEKRRACQVGKIRRELRALAKQYKSSTEGERKALAEARESLRHKLKSLRNTENHRKKRREITHVVEGSIHQ